MATHRHVLYTQPEIIQSALNVESYHVTLLVIIMRKWDLSSNHSISHLKCIYVHRSIYPPSTYTCLCTLYKYLSVCNTVMSQYWIPWPTEILTGFHKSHGVQCIFKGTIIQPCSKPRILPISSTLSCVLVCATHRILLIMGEMREPLLYISFARTALWIL